MYSVLYFHTLEPITCSSTIVIMPSISVVPTVTICPVITEQSSETESCHVYGIFSFISNLLTGSISTGVFVGVVVGLIAVILILIVQLATVLLIVTHKMKRRE